MVWADTMSKDMPLTDGSDPEDGAQLSPAEAERTRGTILIVEDHEMVRQRLAEWVGQSFPDFRVLTAAGGEEGVALADENGAQLVVMDIEMPGTNGIQATRRIKNATPETKVVILSVHSAEDYRSDAFAAGADAYVTKSRACWDLMPRIRELIAPSAQAEPGHGREGA